ncbi:MAG: hypothetical protein Kow0099_08730 [Candidatus Abyssubacteria bacterium]
MKEKRTGERRKAERRKDIEAARNYLGMQRRHAERRTPERRRQPVLTS